MPENSLSQIANDPGKVITAQAALTGFIGVFVGHYSTLSTVEVSTISSAVSLALIWIGRRIINRMDADEALKEPTRALVLLRDKTEQEALAMDEDDPRRPQRLQQAAALTEEIYNRTVETKYELLPPSASQPQLSNPDETVGPEDVQ